MFTQHAPDLWTLAVDHPFLGLKFGARMTVVRLPGGELLLHSPVPLTEERKAAVAALGPVAWVFAPNTFHHLYAGHWAAAFPGAQLRFAPGTEKKRPDLVGKPHDGTNPWGEGLVGQAMEGHRMNETFLWHPASRTLVSSDLYAALPPTDHLWTRFYSWATGLRPEPSMNFALKASVQDKKLARASVDRLLALDPVRVVIAHGTVTEQDGAAAIRSAWSWLA